MSRVHFIGVGGSGMSAVARLTAAAGHEVSGSDQRASHYFEALRDAGMNVTIGHDAANVEGVDQVVISTAVRETNPELARARELGVEIVHRSEALARAIDDQRLVAVAGSHGKTTTSAMVAHVLHGSGIDASFAVGARVFGIEGAVAGGYAGASGIAVVEADESDGSFLRYHPEVAILLNVEPDHLDYYGTVEKLHEAFTAFASDCRVLVVCAEDDTAMEIAGRAQREGVEVVTYGRGDADVVVTETGVSRDGVDYPVEVPVPGEHMRLNAAAAWAAATAMGADAGDAASAVATFGGTGRRYQWRGEAAGVTVIDDYAHHPTEVAALLAAARASGAGRLVVLFQPALFSRTQLHAANFARALSADNARVVIAGVHGDREDPIPGVTSQSILDAMAVPAGSAAEVVEALEDAAARVAQIAQPGDVVLTVGSGPVTYAADWILDALRERDGGGEGQPVE
ncbi:UDP-N-acetylmuramate--L-alanine ligase [Demequina sp. B12]|uniref:UDP-N-acetylmuramate--L-alanine ligase n=1 Tax=Demequina sp. B12 TaxID=2992757 RepID=UPI00237A421A|nr:UDP-N-acetylmuramate--L-alanine ligase [Demequina sp. B12]MDE0573327.1 UDP-N-acetylmuramate--L-alanine ligase [Demequina sp. B12]